MSAQLFPKAVIFDLDGTLIHSAPDLHAALNRLMLLEGRRLLEIAEVVRMIGDGMPKLVKRLNWSKKRLSLLKIMKTMQQN
mgnify:CR=1 FL=1